MKVLRNTRRAVQAGFTLVELLIVVIILAILAAIVIPQFGSSTEDAQVSTLQTNLSQVRNAIELYYNQHNAKYPGELLADGTGTATTNITAPAAFIAQLTQFTNKAGGAQGSKDATHKYGPYLKSSTLPKNPFIDGANAVATVADIAIVDVTTDPVPAAVGTQGWKIWPKIGRIFANDNTTLSDGTTHTATF